MSLKLKNYQIPLGRRVVERVHSFDSYLGIGLEAVRGRSFGSDPGIGLKAVVLVLTRALV